MRDKRSASHLSIARWDLLRRSLLLSLPMLALPVTAWATGAHNSPSSASINVRDKGAIGDGVHDDTAAFQAAIDALPSSGGTVTVPPGNYMIDTARAINMHSNMLLQMAPTVQLRAIPNNLPRSHVIKVWKVSNVQITGGRIVGERKGHLGTTGEWGYGLNIEASDNVSVTDIRISDCWGDGIWIGGLGPDGNTVPATHVSLTRVISTNNRRQGLSIGPVNGVTVVDSTFSNSNGTKPEAGIDIEPQAQGRAQNITISHCTITGNHGTGFEMHDNVAGVVVEHCTIHGNSGYGVLSVGSAHVTITGNLITANGLVGVTIAGSTSNAQITGNTLTGNSARYFHRLSSSVMSTGANEHALDLRVDGSARNVTVSGNTFSP
jgi:parallel beta-helix repeat protein